MVIVGIIQLLIGSRYFFSGRYHQEQIVFSVLAGSQILCGLWFVIYGFYIKKKTTSIEENNKNEQFNIWNYQA